MQSHKRILMTLLAFTLAACQVVPIADTTTQGITEEATLESTPAPTEPGIFTLTSPEVVEGGRLPVDYTCDGDGATLPLAWNGSPAGTAGYALIMHHIAAQDEVHWYWVLYDLPAEVTSLEKNVSGLGTLGNNINNGRAEYSPPCSQGPGDKTYTYTIYALSTQPQLSVPAAEVDRETLLAAIESITLASAELNVVYARPSSSDTQEEGQGKPPSTGAGTPPQAAYQACIDLEEQASCSFTTDKGVETGVCETVEGALACSPKKNGNKNSTAQANPSQPMQGKTAYNIEQAISDKAQGMTIAYDALAFLTGDLGADSFFPPGKVADFWGFQYLRDNDPSQMGHAGEFLTSAAMNILNILTADQRMQLVSLAESQVDDIDEYGYNRFVLMDAFRRLMENDLPAGTSGLDEEAVKTFSADLYELDGQISYARAKLMGSLITSFTAEQKASLDAMVGKGQQEWPVVQEPADLKSMEQSVKVAVMTYAADMFSWYAGSVEADVYFCPERHGTYFGSFYLKDIKAMSDPSYAIPTDITGNMGEATLAVLDGDQASLITGLVDIQKPSLLGIVETREKVSIELRKFLAGGSADQASVLTLMRHYGELDGEIIYNLAANFNAVYQTLTADQKAKLVSMRQELLGDLSLPTGAYLYSKAIPMPAIPNTDFLFK